MKKLITVVSLFVGMVSGLVFANAQQIVTTSGGNSGTACLTLVGGIGYGDDDGDPQDETNGEVALIQQFLINRGYLRTGTLGYFGSGTRAAIRSFQKANGISQNGRVGPITTAKINTLSCNGSNTTSTGTTNPLALPNNNIIYCTTNAYDPSCKRTYYCGGVISNSPCSTKPVSPAPGLLANIQVTSPNVSGVSKKIGDTLTITWNGWQSNVATTTLALELTGNAVGGSIRLFPATSNIQSGSYSWEIPDYILSGDVGVPLTPGSYKITAALYEGDIRCLGFCAPLPDNTFPRLIAKDDSDNAFMIQSASPTLNTEPSARINSKTLKLNYSAATAEAALVARYSISVTSGSKDFTVNKPTSTYSNQAAYFWTDLLNTTTNSSANVSGELAVSASGSNVFDNGTYWTVPAGQTATFTVTRTYNPKYLFAGVYAGRIGLNKAVTSESLLDERTSPVIVVGETSPYISNVIANSDGTITITGQRLNAPGNYLQIDGMGNSMVSKFSPSSTSVTANISAYNLSNGGHVVKITNSALGESNGVYVIINSTVAPTAAYPTVEFIGTPNVSLQYDWVGKESTLVGKAYVKVTAGSYPIGVNNSDSSFVAQTLQFVDSRGVTASANSLSYNATNDQGLTVIPANTSVTFSVTNKIKTSELFSGVYSLKANPNGFTYTYGDKNTYQSLPASSYKNLQPSNTVTVVGETSPYISNVTANTDGTVTITGQRLNLPNNILTVDGGGYFPISKTGPPATSLILQPSAFNLTAGGHSIQINNSITGNSNSYYVMIPATPTTLVPAEDFTINGVAATTAAVPPSITITAGQPVVLKWSSSNAVSCQAYGGWSGDKQLSNMVGETYYPTTTTLYTLTCGTFTGPSPIGVSKMLTVNVAGQPQASSASLVAPTLVSSSPISQYVVGGSNFGIATFKVATAQPGTSATLRELKFTTTGADAIETITVGGVTAPVIGSSSNVYTTISGLSIPVTSAGIDIPVTVKFSGFQNSTTGGSLTTSIQNVGITLSYVSAVSNTSTSISNTVSTPSNLFTLVASKPTVMVGSGGTGAFTLGAENKIGEVTVAADANGKIGLSTITFTANGVGFSSFQISGPRIAVNGVTVPGSQVVMNNSSSPSYQVEMQTIFQTPYEVSAGQSKTFELYGTVAGTQSSSIIVPYITSRLSSPLGFIWRDLIGGNTVQTGERIYNFPTNSFTLRGGAQAISPVTVTSVSATTLGSPVSIIGTRFTSSGNTVYIDGFSSDALYNYVLASGLASNGTSLAFTLPTSLVPECGGSSSVVGCPVSKPLTSGVHTLTVKNASGVSNVASFTVAPVTCGVSQTMVNGSCTNTALLCNSEQSYVGGVCVNNTYAYTCPSGTVVRVPANLVATSANCPDSLGAYMGYLNGSWTPFITTSNISRAEALSNCMTNHTSNPTSSIRCTWNSSEIYTFTPAVTPVMELGVYLGYINGSVTPFITTSNISRAEALSNCMTNHTSNPTSSIRCTWNGVEVYSFTPTSTTVAPVTNVVLNPMKCATPSLSGLSAGKVACYGIWDYGDTLGGDIDMCGGYGAPGLNCLVSTPACISGKATASKTSDSWTTSTDDLQTYANNLRTTPSLLKQNLARIWVYTCTQDSTSVSSLPGGQVLGASATCLDFPFDFHRGNQSPLTKKLQDFLIKKGYMEGEVTGFYGDSTVSAVKDYQKGKGLPQTGMVYEFTRKAMRAETCQ